jgi:hypothetical protein
MFVVNKNFIVKSAAINPRPPPSLTVLMKRKSGDIDDIEQCLTDMGIIKDGYGQQLQVEEHYVSIGPFEAYFSKLFNARSTDIYSTDVCI